MDNLRRQKSSRKNDVAREVEREIKQKILEWPLDFHICSGIFDLKGSVRKLPPGRKFSGSRVFAGIFNSNSGSDRRPVSGS